MATSADHRIYDRWRALIAGLDERWRQTPGFAGLSDDLLRAALAIEQANPTFIRGGRRQHDWKTAVLEQRADLARDAYLALTRATLRKGEQHVEGLRELLNDEPFVPFRAELTLQLLGEFPNATPFRLDELLRNGLGLPAAHPGLLTRAREILSRSGGIDLSQRDLWLASAYFLSPREFEAEIETEAQQRPGLIFYLRDLSGYERHGDTQQPLGLAVSQLEFLARVTGSLFPEAAFPTEGWSGDTNPWDASEFVRFLVNLLSAVPTEAATAALARLESDDRLTSYRLHIRHGLRTTCRYRYSPTRCAASHPQDAPRAVRADREHSQADRYSMLGAYAANPACHIRLPVEVPADWLTNRPLDGHLTDRDIRPVRKLRRPSLVAAGKQPPAAYFSIHAGWRRS